MSADLQHTVNPSLSPRAGIAMLTLQIRATLQEAAEVEAQYVDIDHEAAKRQLRERLEPLIQERTRSFAEAIDAARDEAARTVAAAHDEASHLRAEAAEAEEAAVAEAERVAAEEAAGAEAERVAAEEAAVAEAERVAAEEAAQAARIAAEAASLPGRIASDEQELVEAESAVDAVAIDATPDWAEPIIDTPAEAVADEVVAPDEVLAPPMVRAADAAAPSPFARQTLPPPPPQQINVSIDAEAFAKVFATVFASLVEQRVQHMPPAPGFVPYAIAAPAQAAPAKQGFWRHARHPDVLLLGLATAIVLVVLAAWLA